MKDFKDYKRFPIQIGAQSIIVIHHFSNNSMKDSFELHDMQEENQTFKVKDIIVEILNKI
jgi:hypothetical protein